MKETLEKNVEQKRAEETLEKTIVDLNDVKEYKPKNTTTDYLDIHERYILELN